jgi:3',5'-cyclic AMP phosphodiesterase CpdA
LRIWDLRRGDDDDNRTSPHGRGLRSLVFSAALEFNFLKAPIGFVVLFVVPALLIGVALSLVIAYGRLLLHTPALAPGRPIAAALLLATLAAAGLWLGRPFARLGFDNFWHLHHSLVLPIFVALRELLRSLAERCHRRPADVLRLHRERRVCAVLAAALIAGGGLVVAWFGEISVGVELDILHLRWWTAFYSGLGNAALVLGLSAAVESLYWIWRELSLTAPVLDWAPRALPEAMRRFRVAHLSDLHTVGERYGYRMEAGTAGPRGNRCIRTAWRKLAILDAVAPIERVVLTGDVTDAGTRAEWAEFLDLLRRCPQLRRRLSLVPGNHDLNIIDRANPGRLDLPWSAGQSLRKLRVLLALDTLAGDRCRLIDRASGRPGPTLAEFLRQGARAERLRELAQRGAMRGRRELAKAWEAVFPLVEPRGAGDSCGLILLDSNARSHFSLTNAIGLVSRSQIRALRALLRATPEEPWLVLLHHQVVEYPVASISLRERIGLALVNAPDLIAALAPHSARALVLHGHRHRDWIGVCGGIVLCSAPSATLGVEEADDYRGSFRVDEFAVAAGGAMHLAATERISVA